MDCEGYKFWNLCSQSDKGKDEDFEAKKMCCACGGGSVPTVPEEIPLPPKVPEEIPLPGQF